MREAFHWDLLVLQAIVLDNLNYKLHALHDFIMKLYFLVIFSTSYGLCNNLPKTLLESRKFQLQVTRT